MNSYEPRLTRVSGSIIISLPLMVSPGHTHLRVVDVLVRQAQALRVALLRHVGGCQSLYGEGGVPQLRTEEARSDYISRRDYMSARCCSLLPAPQMNAHATFFAVERGLHSVFGGVGRQVTAVFVS
jgi:hypothetical protein